MRRGGKGDERKRMERRGGECRGEVGRGGEGCKGVKRGRKKREGEGSGVQNVCMRGYL